jgi:hypothetical protein
MEGKVLVQGSMFKKEPFSKIRFILKKYAFVYLK